MYAPTAAGITVARLVRASEKITRISPSVAMTSAKQVRGGGAVVGGDADRG